LTKIGHIPQLGARRQNSLGHQSATKTHLFLFSACHTLELRLLEKPLCSLAQPSGGDPWQTRNGLSRDANPSTATAPTAAPVNSTDCRRTDIARRWAASRSSAAITDRPHSTV